MEGTYIIYIGWIIMFADDDDFLNYLFPCIFARLASLSLRLSRRLTLNQKMPGFCRGYRQASTNACICRCVFLEEDK